MSQSSDPQPRGVKFRQSRYLRMRAKASCQSQLMGRAALILLHGLGQSEYPALFMVKENRLNTPLQPKRNILCLDLKTKLKRWHGSACYYSSVLYTTSLGADVMFCARSRSAPLSLSGRCLVSAHPMMG